MKLSVDQLLINMVKRIPYFKEFSDEDAKHLAKNFKLSYYPSGSAIIIQGEKPDKIYIVKDGTLSVKLANGLKSIEIGKLKSGDIFGEMSFFRKKPAMASVVADTPVDLWEIPNDVFEEFLNKYDYVKENILKIIKEREENNDRLKSAKNCKDEEEDLKIFI